MNQEEFERKLHEALASGLTVHVPNFCTDPQFANMQMTVESIVKKLGLAKTRAYQYMGESWNAVAVELSLIALSDAPARTARAISEGQNGKGIHVSKTLEEFVDDMDSGRHVWALLDAPSVNGEVPACLR